MAITNGHLHATLGKLTRPLLSLGRVVRRAFLELSHLAGSDVGGHQYSRAQAQRMSAQSPLVNKPIEHSARADVLVPERANLGKHRDRTASRTSNVITSTPIRKLHKPT